LSYIREREREREKEKQKKIETGQYFRSTRQTEKKEEDAAGNKILSTPIYKIETRNFYLSARNFNERRYNALRMNGERNLLLL
jgi:hypothetical protein